MTDERLEREAAFHDQLYADDRDARAASEKYYSVLDTCRREYFDRITTGAGGSRVLEYGCGPGGHAALLANAGASVVAIDVSSEAIRQAKRRLSPELGIEVLEMNAEAMTFAGDHFDLVCGSGILHHLDLAKAFAEIRRVLRPGGRAVFVEPLGHNPIINAYRRFTPSMRSADEHPLMQHDLDRANDHFDSVELDYYSLTTLAAVPLRKTKLFGPVSNGLERLDEMVMRSLPFARRFSWNVLIELGIDP